MIIDLNQLGWICPFCSKQVKKTNYISSVDGQVEDGRYHPGCLEKAKKKEENYD